MGKRLPIILIGIGVAWWAVIFTISQIELQQLAILQPGERILMPDGTYYSVQDVGKNAVMFGSISIILWIVGGTLGIRHLVKRRKSKKH